MLQDYNEAYCNLDIDMQDIAVDDNVVEYTLSESSVQV